MYISEVNLSDISRNLWQGKMDLIQYINELCDKIESIDQHLHTLLDEPNRRNRLIKDAKELQERFSKSKTRPPLYGVPVGIKDIIRTDGLPTRAGSKLPTKLFEGEEASCVKSLRDAGALILGKTVTTEFAHFVPGPTVNPHNVEYTPGGSSSGSAAIVAAGLSPLSIGTQTSGSVLRPAAFCGVIGYKPTYDRIAKDGLVYCAKSVDHLGIFTQDMTSMKIGASLLCQDWKNDDVKTSNPIIGVPEGPYLNQVSEEALELFYSRLKDLKEAGFTIKYIPMFENLLTIETQHNTMVAWEIANYHKDWFVDYESLYGLRTRQTIQRGQNISVESYQKAKDARISTRSQIETEMDQNNIDIWICPSALGPALKGLKDIGNPAMNIPWTNAGLPSISLPVDKTKDNLPIGIQLVTRYMQDEQLLYWANQLKNDFVIR